MISILSGANNIVTAEDIVASKHIFSSASYCMIQTEVPMDAVLKAAELAKEYQIAANPTLLFVKNAEVLDRKIGAHTLAELKTWVEALL